ncbi:hypothetical protein C8Q76DRAFT_748563 [Earliella scabrosa]|nr:hypothetical protein C8Q76DRAFT_748563 [Earliella scabrosa]
MPPRKSKKRTLLDSDDFIQADLDWFDQTKRSIQPNAGTSGSVPAILSPPSTPVQSVAQAVAPRHPTPPPTTIAQSTTLVATSTTVNESANVPSDSPHPTPRAIASQAADTRKEPTPVSDNAHPRSPPGVPHPVRTKSPSFSTPPRDSVQLPLKRKAPDDEVVPANGHHRPHSTTLSPTLLAPSLARRRSPTDATENAEAGPSVSKSKSPPSANALPSPLGKNMVKKRKKGPGPPGFKVLPILAPETNGQDKSALPESAESLSSGVGLERASASVSQSKSASPGHDPPPPRVPSPPTRRASQPPHIPGPASAPSPPDTAPNQTAPPPADPSPPPVVASELPASCAMLETLRPPEAPSAPDAAAIASPDVPPSSEVAAEEPLRAATPHAISKALLEETSTIVASPDAMDLDDLPQPPVAVAEERVEPQEQQLNEDAVMREPSPPRGSHEPTGETEEVSMDLGSDDAPAASPADLPVTASTGERVAEQPIGGDQGASISEEAMRLSGSPLPAEVNKPLARVLEHAIDPTDSPFRSRSARLLSLVCGSSAPTPALHPVEMDFDMTAEDVAQLTRWNDRHGSTADVSTSLCVSLVTYTAAQCASALQGELDVVSFGHPAEWPRDGSVFMTLDISGDHGQPQRFYVSPPFNVCNADRSVDLGARGLHPGTNTLRMYQYRDHSDRMFAVVLHHPTAAQLAELQKARDSEVAWRSFVDGLGKFDLPAPRLLAPPVPENAVSGS